MTTLTLLTRAHSDHQLNQISDALKLPFEGLDVEAKVLGTTAGKWVQIALSGEDATIATSYIAKEIGFCPTSIENLEKLSTLKGYIVNFEKNTEALVVDVGVFQPKTIHAEIPLSRLQTQLVDGRKTALRKLGELFGFCGDLPLNITVTSVDEEENRIEAELSAQQVETYAVWQEALLDKLLVLNVPLRNLKNALEYAKLNRDIISVEPLGLFEHVLTCKLGTDAAGLIPKLGRILKKAKFAVFNPRKLRAFLKS
jgi:hypothetical protein